MTEKMKKEEKGFTLMEMLIVVAIIAVLVAIAIPTFSSSLSKARKAACLANRRGLYAEVTGNYMLGEEIHGTELSADEAKKYVCPAGGKITVSFNETKQSFDIICSKHGSLFDANGNGINSTPIGAISNAVNSLLENGAQIWNGPRKRVDSTTTLPNSMAGQIKAELAASGVDMDSLGAKTWTLVKSKDGDGMYTIWSSYKIMNEAGGKEYKSVPAISLSPDGKTYVVGVTNVVLRNSSENGVVYSYYVIASGVENAGFNPSKAQSFDSIEKAQEYYNTLQPIK